MHVQTCLDQILTLLLQRLSEIWKILSRGWTPPRSSSMSWIIMTRWVFRICSHILSYSHWSKMLTFFSFQANDHPSQKTYKCHWSFFWAKSQCRCYANDHCVSFPERRLWYDGLSLLSNMHWSPWRTGQGQELYSCKCGNFSTNQEPKL